jgi:hypothetical protein
VDVVKRLETMSLCELSALDATVLHCLRGTYQTNWGHGPHTSVRVVYRAILWDFEDGVTQPVAYSRGSLLKALRWELTEGRARKVYANTIRAAIDPAVDMTMVEAGEGKL